MKYLALTTWLFVSAALADELSVSSAELSPRDIANLLGLQATKLRISHADDSRLTLTATIAVFRKDPSGKVTRLREKKIDGDGLAPDWAHTDIIFGLYNSQISVGTTQMRIIFPPDFTKELTTSGVIISSFEPIPSEYGYIIYQTASEEAVDTYFLAVDFSPSVEK